MKKGLFPVLAAAAFAFVLGCASEPKREPPFDAVTPLEPGEEFAFGRSIAARLMVGKEVVTDERARRYVAQVGGVVAAASARPDPYDGYRFYIVRDDHVAWYSAPGGFVFVTTGAIRACRNEDQLAGVLAQEMAHSALGHALAGEPVLSVRPTRESWPHAPEWGAEQFRAIAASAAARATGGWTEAQEREASEWAAAALKRSGYGAGGVEARAARFESELAAVR
ncbi:MAG: M48 family metalloprotease [Planctomycetes bacterium]|nr:M48 family metalloprotease [Planctomycetota bacterium]